MIARVLTAAEFESSKSNFSVQTAPIKSAQIAVDRAKQQLNYTSIYSPIDGVIVERNVDVGQTVAASLSAPQLFLIANDLDRMQILASVDESDIGQIKDGQPVQFTVQSYPSEKFQGEVQQVRLQSTTTDNVVNYTAVVSVKNVGGKLLPGMTATVEFLTASASNVLTVPNAALRIRPTPEMLAKNHEITSQNEELRTNQETLSLQNKQLQEAQQIIKEQSVKIQSLNDHLKIEVDNRTQELQKTNQELIEHNNQLEQFAFIAAHNLRAPLTRVLGLANLIQMGETEADKQAALDKLISSTHDLDQVVKDLNAILNIKRHTANFSEVDLNESLTRTKRILEKEIEDTGTKIINNFSEADKVYAIGPYVESILYNLISNAIKYRDPQRVPYIAIKTTHEKEFVCLAVMDNGLGIDLKKYKQNIFSLYKRFHLHVEGKGLGLYLVKTQIEALGGRVEVRSEPNEGTTFHVYFKRYLI